jgi:hypothetical protein
MAGRILPAISFRQSQGLRRLNVARESPSRRPVTLRRHLARTLVGTLMFLAALISVGLAAPADSLFTIEVTPVFLRLDAAAVSESRASALGLDVDIKIWTLHLHFTWSAVPMPALTKPPKALAVTYVVQAFRPAAPRAGRAEALHYVSGATSIEVPFGSRSATTKPGSRLL